MEIFLISIDNKVTVVNTIVICCLRSKMKGTAKSHLEVSEIKM